MSFVVIDEEECTDKISTKTPTSFTIAPHCAPNGDPELLEAIINALKNMEESYEAPVVHHVMYRRVLVDWIVEVSESFRLPPSVYHSAVSFMDQFLTKVSVEVPQLQLVAAISLLIAAKLIEEPDMVPTIRELNATTDNAYPEWAFIKMELLILSKLGWNMSSIHPMTFLNCFSSIATCKTDMFGGRPIAPGNFCKIERYVHKYCQFFLEIYLQESTFFRYKPSLIAASAIAASRHVIGITPTWPDQLKFWMGYEQTELSSCFSQMCTAYKQTKESTSTPPNVRTVAGELFI